MHANDLKHGRVYDCTMDGNRGVEKTSIVPLATDAQTRQRFIIIDAQQLQKGNPDFFRRLIAMSFSEIVDEDLDGRAEALWSSFVWRFTIDEHGSLYFEDFDLYLGDFVETDINK
jgi:hypothetical protein